MGIWQRLGKTLDAFTLSPEAYMERYAGTEGRFPADDYTRIPIHLPATRGEIPVDEPRMLLSGGTATARYRVLNQLLTEQARIGYAVVLLQPVTEPLPLVFDAVYNATDGSYDPLLGLDAGTASVLLEDAAAVLSVKPSTLHFPLYDCLTYLSSRNGGLGIDAFLTASTRTIGYEAFRMGQTDVAATHALPESREIDYLRERLRIPREGGQTGQRASIRSALRQGGVTVFRVPQRPAWFGLVLSELNLLLERGDWIFPVFNELAFREEMLPLLSRLRCGRCFSGQDIPGTPALWREVVSGINAACFLRHSGPSAEQVSGFFHTVERRKETFGTQSGSSRCNTGGFMGLFGSNTRSAGSTMTTTFQWEALISAYEISNLGEEQAVFLDRGDVWKATV